MLFRTYLHLVENKISTNTPNFKRWFANSKVVDEHGKPMIMYHGTRGDFTKFFQGSHFGSSKAANNRLRYTRGMTGNEKIMPVYLKITNPYRVEDLDSADEASLFNSYLKKMKIGDDKNLPKINIDLARREGMYKAMQKAGYDGLVYSNRFEDNGNDSWVVFNTNQVKSAISNNGDYDQNSDHIHEFIDYKI